MKSSEVISWSAPSKARQRTSAPLRDTLQLTGLHLRPNWYRLRVWVRGPSVRVSARAAFTQSRADLRMYLEARSRHRLEKIFKISEPLASIDISAEGGGVDTQIDRIEIRRMGKSAVFAFLAGKGLRYAISNRNRLDWKHAWNHFRAALRPRGSFVFQGRYAGNSDADAYARWRALHEEPSETDSVLHRLDEKLAGRAARVALIVGAGMDDHEFRTARQSLQSRPGKLEFTAIQAGGMVTESASREMWDFALILDRKGSFTPMAAERMLLELLDDPEIQAVFADSDTISANGEREKPLLKPPLWDAELLWSSDYIRAPLMLRWTPKIGEILNGPGAPQRPGYALALMLSDDYDRDQLRHIPAILFHERRRFQEPGLLARRQEAEANTRRAELDILNAHLQRIGHPCKATAQAATRRVAWPLSDSIQVSIIIPSKDNPGLLDTCITSIREVTVGAGPEIVVADNGSVKPETRAYLRQLEFAGIATVVPCPGRFNFSKINNDARRHATGNILVFLNDDTRILSADWLIELASLAARPDIGAVGGLLLYPDGAVQHAGILLGIRGIADHAFRHLGGDAPGYLELLRCRRRVTAVTGACLAVSASHFDAVGGFDEALAVVANDIDLCLRLDARGWANVWSPWCVVEHAESRSRGIDSTDAALDRQGQEMLLFTRRWGHLLDCDPTYNPGLSRVNPDFSLGVE